jgi:hypothetical protein
MQVRFLFDAVRNPCASRAGDELVHPIRTYYEEDEASRLTRKATIRIETIQSSRSIARAHWVVVDVSVDQ